MAVPFAGVNRPKLMKRMASQQTRDNQQRRGDRAARLLVEKPPHLAEFHGFRHRLGFERALRFVLRRQRLDAGIQRIARGGAGIELNRFGCALRPKALQHIFGGAVEQRARGGRLGTVMGQHAVQHHELCPRRDDIIFLGVVGTLCGGNHQSKDEGRDRCQQSSAGKSTTTRSNPGARSKNVIAQIETQAQSRGLF